jgi:hypothetical protein
MITLNKYRIWCETEQMYYETWGETSPPACPNNSGHTIDSTKTTIVNSLTEEELRDISGKLRVQQSSRPIGTKIHFTGKGDHPEYVSDVGGGQPMKFDHHIGDSLTQIMYVDFNFVENRSFIHEGYVTWTGCKFDTISLEIVPTVTPTIPATNTPYFVNPAMPHIVLPKELAGGLSNVDITSDLTQPRGGLIYMPQAGDVQFGRPPAYWNADYNKTTHLYENISPAPGGDGRYNIFTVEFAMSVFANELILMGENALLLKTSDTEELGHGMRVRITANTHVNIDDNEPDHDWGAGCMLTMHRTRSI